MKEVFFVQNCLVASHKYLHLLLWSIINMKYQKFASCLVYEFTFLKIHGEEGEISFYVYQMYSV